MRGELMDARQLAEAGSERALAHANLVLFTWGDEALGWVREALKLSPKITAGYVRDLATLGKLPEAPEPRAWGAVMKRAQREGIIKPTKDFICTNRLASHGRPERVWEAA